MGGQSDIPNNYPTKVVARADFQRNGSMSLFVAYATYDVSKPLADATSGRFEFWTGDAKTKIAGLLNSEVGCMVPSSAAVADYNGDGRPDVFVACHGYDAAPFPGEKSYVVLSKADGTYASKPATDDVGFFHGASAADLDADGDVDVAVATGTNLKAYVNDGAGGFTLKSDAFPMTTNKSLYTVEVVDVDSDGKVDVLAGGHEYGTSAADTILLKNDGSGGFASVVPTVIPTVTDQTIVVGFAVVQKNVYVVRTRCDAACQAGSVDPAHFYGTNYVQKVDLASMGSSEAYNVTTTLPLYNLIDIGGKLVSELALNPVAINY